MKFKKVLSMVVSMSLVFSLSANVFAATASTSVKINGILTPMLTKPEVISGTTMVNMVEFLPLIGAKSVWDSENKKISIVRENVTVSMKLDSTDAFVNDMAKKLSVAPYFSGPNLMVPMSFVCEAFGSTVIWNNDTRTIDVKTKDGKLVGVDLTVLKKDSVITGSTTKLSFKTALDASINSNSQVSNIAENLEYMKEVRGDLKDSRDDIERTIYNLGQQHKQAVSDEDMAKLNLYYNPTPENYELYQESIQIKNQLEKQQEVVEEQLANVLRQEKSVRNQISNVDVNKQMIADGNEYMLRSYVTNINGYALDIQSMEAKIELSKLNKNNVALKQSIGLVSDTDLKLAELALEQDIANLNSLKLMLKSEREALNHLLGYTASRDVYVVYEPTVTPLIIDDLNQHIRLKIEKDPSIYLKKQAVDEASYKITTAKDISSESELQNENNLKKAKRDYEDAKTAMDKEMRSTYNSIKQLEQKQKLLELDIKKAVNDYNNALASYEAGNITLYNVNMARLGILQAETAMVKNAFTYANTVFLFNTPYMLVR